MIATDFLLDADFIPTVAADGYLKELLTQIEWRQDTLRIYGREHSIPRLHQWYADKDIGYSWSGLDMNPQNWITPLDSLRELLREKTGYRFNSVLANLYRDGNDSMGWHADNEPELGNEPVIASISLGAERDFQIRKWETGAIKRHGPAVNMLLPHGSLLLMSGASQRDWQHALPKRRRITLPRVNLTFRLIRR